MLELSDDRRSNAEMSPADAVVLSLFARIDIIAFTIAAAAVAALAMFLATAALLVVGAPPGQPVGPHLSALSTFWPGFTVSWTGAPVGAFYAALCGGAAGFMLALFWNFAHLVIVGLAALRFATIGAE